MMRLGPGLSQGAIPFSEDPLIFIIYTTQAPTIALQSYNSQKLIMTSIRGTMTR